MSSLDAFLGVEPVDPDDELRRILAECHGFFGTTVDIWKLEQTISDHPELWWSRGLRCNACNGDVIGYSAQTGYFCEAHFR